jgi:uncharacterized coiled-coil protein SlyX
VVVNTESLAPKKSHWQIIYQTVAIILTLIGLALAGERRMVVLEQRQTNTEQAIVELKDIAIKLVDKQDTCAQNLVRVSTILETLNDDLKQVKRELRK